MELYWVPRYEKGKKWPGKDIGVWMMVVKFHDYCMFFIRFGGIVLGSQV